ncbi:MAG: hypothetical protein ABIR92_06350 [Gemmatimonadaceae bacterium]
MISSHESAGCWRNDRLRVAECAGCARCHVTNAHVNPIPQTTGLDATVTDIGAGNGTFKSPSLRNAGIRGRYMHGGRFTSLERRDRA